MANESPDDYQVSTTIVEGDGFTPVPEQKHSEVTHHRGPGKYKRKPGRPPIKRAYTPRHIQNDPPLTTADAILPDTVSDVTSVQTEAEPTAKHAPVQPDGDLIDIWERRLLNPAGTTASKIRITRPGMHMRWINLAARGRYQRARYDQGYVPVTQNLLVDPREIYGVTYTTEGYVCRGEKQSEMLMMIPEAIYRQIQQRRSDLNKKSYANLRENLRQAGSTHFGAKYGGSAGEQASDAAGRFKGSIAFGTERIQADGTLTNTGDDDAV